MKISTREMILAALFAALTAVGAFIKIPIGLVALTLQLLFIVLVGIMLGSKLGAFSQLIYMIMDYQGCRYLLVVQGEVLLLLALASVM